MSLATHIEFVDTKSASLLPALRSIPGAPVYLRGGSMQMKSKWQILVVDDEEVMCESLAAWLREDGYVVDTAAPGAKRRREGAGDATTPSTSSI